MLQWMAIHPCASGRTALIQPTDGKIKSVKYVVSRKSRKGWNQVAVNKIKYIAFIYENPNHTRTYKYSITILINHS